MANRNNEQTTGYSCNSKEGLLSKYRNFLLGWGTKYMKLDRSYLHAFDAKDAPNPSGSLVRGEIVRCCLDHSFKGQAGPHVFNVVCRSGSTWYLRADSWEVMAEWMIAIWPQSKNELDRVRGGTSATILNPTSVLPPPLAPQNTAPQDTLDETVHGHCADGTRRFADGTGRNVDETRRNVDETGHCADEPEQTWADWTNSTYFATADLLESLYYDSTTILNQTSASAASVIQSYLTAPPTTSQFGVFDGDLPPKNPNASYPSERSDGAASSSMTSSMPSSMTSSMTSSSGNTNQGNGQGNQGNGQFPPSYSDLFDKHDPAVQGKR